MKNIRSIFIALVACMVAFAFTSCQKDGVYKPKKKISKIYTSKDGGDRILQETWNWDGKVLTSIVFNDDEDIEVKFEYDKKQLTALTSGDARILYTYDGNLLDKITWMDGNEEVASYTFKHNGKFISAVDAVIDNGYLKNTRLLDVAFRTIDPIIAETEVAQFKACQAEAKGLYKYGDIYEYDHNNVVSIKRHDNNNDDFVWTYTYSDRYLNPFYHLLSPEGIADDVVGYGLSKNAVASSHYEDTYISSRVIDMEVTFPKLDGKYPVEETRTEKTTHTVGSLTNIYTSATTYYYEYE